MKPTPLTKDVDAPGIRTSLAVLMVGCIVPLALAAALLLLNFYAREQTSLTGSADSRAYVLMVAADHDAAATRTASTAMQALSINELDELKAGLHQSLLWLLVATVTATLLALALAWFIGGRIAQAITALIQPAIAIDSGAMLPIPDLHFKEANALGQALFDAATRMHRTQVGLRESNIRLTLAADAAHLGIWIRDIVYDEIWASEQWRALFGFSAGQRIELLDVLLRIHPEDRSAVSRILNDSLHGVSKYETEYRIALPDGKERWIASRGNVEYDSGGKPLLVRGVSFDITIRRQAELDVRLKEKEIMHLSRVTMLGELSGALAHELNQPLTAILSNAQAAQRFLARDNINEVRDILQDIVDEDKRAGEVIRRLRGLLRSGEIQPQTVDLNILVSEVAKLLRNDHINQGIELRIESALDQAFVHADPVQVQQVLINLIMNATDAMNGVAAPGRRVTVRTRPGDGATIQVSVIDQGCGIPDDCIEKIFDAFYTTKTNGMGLGLAICRNIVEVNGGRLWVENNPDHGASFHFCLPLPTEITP